MKKTILIIPAAVLAMAVMLQFYIFLNRPQITKTEPLDTLISTRLPGWFMEELPLGETEEVRNAVERRLRFDDVISRVYTSGSTQVGVYIAYWEPGKIPVRLVGVHTPDTCWVQNGWTCEFREHSVEKSVDDLALKPGEFGIFESNGNRQHVLFWHVVGNRLNTYEQQGMHALTAAWNDILNFGLNQRQEQYFIRISSNRPFAEIWTDPGFELLMRDISRLGIQAEPPDAGSDDTLAGNL